VADEVDPAATLAPQASVEAVATLLGWYRAQRRDLPWRQTTDPYRIWLAESRLQQTQVVTVIPYYLRFLERYPTVQALAAADLDELLALWQGLGYYARARSLRRTAQLICERHSGQVPADRRALLALPGIGAYTAGAILSIAFGQAAAAVDGNVKRVLARWFDLALDSTTPAARRRFDEMTQRLLSPEAPGDYNQAMMELGATVCTPRTPTCSACPLNDVCLAHARGTIAQRPVLPPRRRAPTRALVAAHCVWEGRLLIVRRPPSGLLGGLWELPNWELPTAIAPAMALQTALQPHAPAAQVGAPLAVVRHAYTHFAVQVHVLSCTLTAFDPADTWDAVHWLARDELEHYGLTGVTLKAMRNGPWLTPARYDPCAGDSAPGMPGSVIA